MAINKVVNKSTKSHGAMRNVLEYVLRDEKVKEGYVEIAGPYSGETINYDEVYRTWISEKRLWDKDTGRMYAHNIISFHKDEHVTPEQVLDIGRKFAERFFAGHQYVIGVHQDKEHLHCHIVTNSVSYLDGLKLHQNKRDLEQQKEFTNDLCLEKGLSVAKKGHHFDGSVIEEGEIIAWKKDKYNLIVNDSKKSYVAECAMALLDAKEGCCSKEDFIKAMEERGWHTIWTDHKKHITFQNENGDKVRDSNLAKTFEIDVCKEALNNEFERSNERRLAQLEADRAREQYYARVKSAIQGEGTSGSGNDENTTSFIRELRAQERAAAQKRDDSSLERADREAERKRSRAKAERAAREAKQRATAERTEIKRRSRSYDIDR